MDRSRLPTAGFWAGLVLLAAGFAFHHLWSDIPGRPLTGFAGLALISLLLAEGVLRALRCSRATAMLFVWICALAGFSGVASVLAVVLVAAAAVAVGRVLLPPAEDTSVALAMLAGLAMLCGIAGWLLPFPVHLRVVYVTVLVVVVVLRRRVVAAAAGSIRTQWSSAVTASPRASFLAVLCMGLVSSGAWLPTTDYDALVYHLALPSQLAELGYYQMNAASNVWALAPWAADVCQAMAWLVAGAESVGAVGVLWLGLTLVLLWQLARELGLVPWSCWMAVALYGSLPLVAGTLTSMQTEGPTAATLAGLALLIQKVRAPTPRHVALAGALFGLLLALKISNVMFAGPLGLWLLWQWRGRLPWRGLPLALLLALLVAGSSYVYAYVLTGNPVLPLFNATFHSPFYPPADFHDGRWDSGLSWDLPWKLVFNSPAYGEIGNGTGPFVLIGLAGSLLLALCSKRTAALTLAAVVAFALPLTQIQYLRYPMPAMVLLIPAMLCGLRCECLSARQVRSVAIGLGALVVVSLVFAPNASWQLKSGAVTRLVKHGADRVMRRYAVERNVADVIRHRHGRDARTLLLDPQRPFAAELAGRAFVTAWYDPELSRLAAAARAGDEVSAWSRLLVRSGANLLMVSTSEPSPGLRSTLAAFHGNVVYTAGDIQLWALRPPPAGDASSSAPDARPDLSAERDLARRLRDRLAFWERRGHSGSPPS
jgi:hypothetical protein